MLSNVLSGSNIFGVTVTLWDFSKLMQNWFAERAGLIWNKVPHKKYKTSNTVLWETWRRVQENSKHTSTLYKRSIAQGTSWSHRWLFFWHKFVWSYSEVLLNFWPTAGWADFTGQSTWMWWFHISTFQLLWVMLWVISPFPGTCHLQPSHPLGLHNSK